MEGYTFNDAAHKSAQEVAALVIRKRRDYGPGNITNSIVDSRLAIAVRLNDKIARLVNLVNSGATPENESLLDTADDIIGYGIVLKLLLKDEITLPLKED